MVRMLLFAGEKMGKLNSPIKNKDGLTPLDHIFKSSCKTGSIMETDKRGKSNGNKRTFQ